MATRAEQFKAEQTRKGPPKPKKVARRPPAEVLDEGLGNDAPHHKRGTGHTKTRNLSEHAGKKASVALEDSATRPSRKSTRDSANRSKFESALRRREIIVSRSAD